MLEQFYQDLVPPGQKVLATIDEKDIQHYVVDSTAEIIPCLKRFPEYNTYHSLGAYQGLKPGPLFKVKNLEGCIGVRMWAFDLDVGDKDTEYETLEDAYEALAQGVEEGYIPEPRWVIYSGGGLQFYLAVPGGAFEQGLPEELWSSYFQKIRSHFLKNGLKLDRTVGSHPYRLLRSPCTPNWKYEEPVEPEILNEEAGPQVTQEWLDSLEEPVAPSSTKTYTDDSSLAVERPVSLKKVLKACKALRQEYDTKGEQTPYGRWVAVANACAHTFEFRKGFHALSKGHPEYTEEGTNEKFDEIAHNASAGPWGCDNFGNASDPDSPCHGCWANQMGLKNPISAARHFGKRPPKTIDIKVLDEVAELPTEELGDHNNWGVPEHHMPGDFFIDDGQMWNDAGPVCKLFYIKRIQFNEDRNLGSIQVSTDRKVWYPLAAKKLSMPAACVSELLNVGIMVWNDKATMAYLRQGSMLDGKVREAGRFGWDTEFSSFYMPTGMVGASPTEPSEDLTRLQKKWGASSGSLEGWLDAISIYGRPGQQAYLMAVLASMASPLLAYHNLEKGVIMSLTGPGGTGKSTALKAAASVWGRPLQTIASMSSTFVATRIYLGLCGHAPMIFDEITQMPVEDLKQLALEISQGLGRERGTKEANLAHSETWQLNMITTSNTSLHAKLAEMVDVGSADMNRVIELPVIQSEFVSLQQGNELLEGIHQHHGHMGNVVISKLLDKNIEQERKDFARMLASFRKVDSLRGRDRFADSLIASCYWMHKLAKEVAPAFPGDPEEMFMWMRNQLSQNNQYIEDVLKVRVPSPDDFLIDFIAENLVVQEINEKGYMAQGQSMKGYLYDAGEWMIVTKSVLDGWCKRHLLTTRTVLESWARSGRLQNMGPSDDQVRWTGKLKGGLTLEGKTSYPTVIMLHKGKLHAKKSEGTGSPGTVTRLKLPPAADG